MFSTIVQHSLNKTIQQCAFHRMQFHAFEEFGAVALKKEKTTKACEILHLHCYNRLSFLECLLKGGEHA